MYQVIIETGSADTQPYRFESAWDLGEWIRLILTTYNGQVTVTVDKIEEKPNGGMVEE